MRNFKQLTQEEYDKVWDQFYNLFHFNPGINNFPAIKTNKPQLKFDIKNFFSKNDNHLTKLEEVALTLFNRISKFGDRLYALNWQHQCYDFDPRKQMDRDEFGEWIVPVFPNGDYYIFLTKDFENIGLDIPGKRP